MGRVFAPGDPRARRPVLEPVPWHRDRGVLGSVLTLCGVAGLVLGVLFFDQLFQFVNGVDLESRYGRCTAESPGECATVEQGTVLGVSGSTLTVSEGGITFNVAGTSGAPASSFTKGEAVETESVGGPVAEIKAGGDMLFTRYYVPQNPFYAIWQGAAFGVLAFIWLVVYAWGMARADLRTPIQVIRRQ